MADHENQIHEENRTVTIALEERLQREEESLKPCCSPSYRSKTMRKSGKPTLQRAYSSYPTRTLRNVDITKSQSRAVYAVLLCSAIEAIHLKCLAPNYALLVIPGLHGDSWPNTYPLGFTSAQYMIFSAAKVGTFIADLIAGWLTNKYGKRRVILANLAGSMVFTLMKYFCRHSYWLFVAATFANGLFASTGAIGLGYIAQVYAGDRVNADRYFSYRVVSTVLGGTLGGLLTVFFPNHLFLPVLPATTITLLGLICAYTFIEESVIDEVEVDVLGETEKTGRTEVIMEDKGRLRSTQEPCETLAVTEGTDETEDLLHRLDFRALVNILFGAFADIAGSIGFVPLCLSPLMFDTYYGDFVEQDQDPIMSEQAYRWVFSTILLLLIPVAFSSARIFQKFGVAQASVIASLLTGGFIVSLLAIATRLEPTRKSFAIYVTGLYAGYPATIISSLATSPMVDRIAPLHKKGLVQGMNAAVRDGTKSILPLCLGLIVDSFGIATTLWICTGLCILAALVNLPLAFHTHMQRDFDEEADKVEISDEGSTNTINA